MKALPLVLIALVLAGAPQAFAGRIVDQGRPIDSRVGICPTIDTIRGALKGMPAPERLAPKEHILLPAFKPITGGRDNYGLGSVPDVDPFPSKSTQWTALKGTSREAAKAQVREKLYQALI